MIIYRMATPDDLAFIYHALKSMATEEGIVHRFSQTQESLNKAVFSHKRFAEVLIAEVNGNKAAICLFSMTKRNFHLFDHSGIFVHDLYVDVNNRKIGLATGLIKELRKIATQRNCDRIEGIVLNDNTTATNFSNSIADAKVVDYMKIVRISKL